MEFMKSGTRQKVKYRHKNSMHTTERLVAQLNKSATLFLITSTLLNKTDVLIMKNNDKLQSVTTQLCIIKLSLF